MTTYNVKYSQNIDNIGNMWLAPIDGTRTLYWGETGQSTWTTTGNVFSGNVTWTGWDTSDEGLTVFVAAAGTCAATLAPQTTGSATTNTGSLPAGAAWKKCVFGNGSFVSVNTSSTTAAYMRPNDAQAWVASTLPSAAAWSLLAYGNGVFLTVAPSSTSGAVSVNNGATWTAITLPASLAWTDLKYANGFFILITSGSRDVYTSPDGATGNWTLRSNALPSTGTWKQLAWANIGGANGTWVVVPSSSTTAAYSTDNGVTWTAATLPAAGNWIVAGGVAPQDGIPMFTALTISSTVGAFSFDGIIWQQSTITSAAYNAELKLSTNKIVSGDALTVINGSTLTVNTDQKTFLTGATALVVTNGKVVVSNSSTTTPIRFGTGRLATTAALSTIDCTNGLATFETSGDWIEVGTSNGTASQTFTSPYTTGDYIPTLFVETGSGTGVYEPWVNVTGAATFNQYNYIRNGFRSVGKGDGGTCFTQDHTQASCQYLFLANSSCIANTNIVTCTSTTGLVPGTWLFSRSLSGGTAVVKKVINSTTFMTNIVVSYSSSSSVAGYFNIPMVAIKPLTSQFSTTLRFGDGVNGKIPPNGAKIRVQNILLTDYSPANFMNAVLSGTNAPFHLRSSSGGGKFVLNKTLLGESYSNLAQASAVTITDVGGTYVPFISECYAVSFNNVGFGLPPVYQVVGAPTALGATGSSTATSTTISIPSSTAIIPGVLLTATTQSIHPSTVTTVSSATSLIISNAAHTTATSTVAYSYYGLWTPRDNRMLLATTAAFGSSLTTALWTYVSNANIQKLVMTFGGHSLNGASTSPSVGSTHAGFFSLAYSNDVVINDFKGIMVGSYPKTRPNHSAFLALTAGNNHTYSNIKLYNVNGVAGASSVSNITASNITHNPGINQEGYNWASLYRVFTDVENNQFLPKDTKYWFKTRSYKTHDFHDTTGYIDSIPMCAVHGNFDKYKQMPQRYGVLPTWSQSPTPAMAYGNGVWVFLDGSISSAAFGPQCVMVSDDNGATWTSYQLSWAIASANVYLRDIIWCPTQGYFMVIGGGGAATNFLAISTNGKDWSGITTVPASAQWQKLAFDNSQASNKWVAVSGGSAVSTAGTYATITNGSIVFAASTLASAQWISVASNGAGRFVAIAGGSAVGTASSISTNGSTWSAGGALASSLWQDIAFGNSLFVAISASATNGPTSRSTDGTTWTAGTAPTLPTGMVYSKILYTGSVFVIMAGPAWTTTSHTTYVHATASSAFATSTDGITWSALKYLPDHTSWIAMANNGNAVGFLSTQSGRFAYTSDISVATPTFTLYTGVMPVWNRISVFHQSTEFTTALNTAASVGTTNGSTTVTCTSTAGLQVGSVIILSAGNCLASGVMALGAGTPTSQTNAAIITSITNATTFEINKPATKTESSLTSTIVKGVYQLYRSTTPGFTARDATTLIGATQSITAGQMIFNDYHQLVKGTTYYYRLRKLSGGGAASIVNCSGTAATATITTQGSWYYWQAGFDFDGKNGSNVITSLVLNFFAAGIVPGCIVTGPGIPVGTTVTAVPDFDTIILSANLTADVVSRGTNRTWVGFSPAPGMYIFGSNVGWDSKVVTVDSATSMTVSVNNTNTFTNQTLRFVFGEEMPEVACIAQAPKVIQNNALQSTTLATTWTASNITATNAAVLCPIDYFVGLNGAAPTGTGCTLYAAAANGTLTQSINTGVGQTYTFSCYARARHPDLRSYITMKMDLGTATQTHTLTNQWTRYSVSFTTTANTTNAVFTLPAMGTVVEVAAAMVTLLNEVPCPTPATTTSSTVFVPQQSLAFTDGLAGYFLYDAPNGIVTNLQTAPVGQHWAHLHTSNTGSNFTLSDLNQVFSTETGSATDQLTYSVAATINFTVDNYQPVSQYASNGTIMLRVETGTNGVIFKSSKFPLNGTTGNLLAFGTAAYNVYMHDIELVNPRNYIATTYPDNAINNASNNLKFQNVKATNSGIQPWGNQALNMIFKGAYGCDSLPLNNATTWNLSSNPTQDSLPTSTTSLAAVYDSNFHEMTFGATGKGCLDLRLVPSTKTTKPYTIVSGTPVFDSAGGLAFNTANDVVTFEWPHFIKGVTGFSKRFPHIYGVDIGLSPVTSLGALVEYDIDRGAGYSAVWKRVNSIDGMNNLAAEAAIDPAVGFRIKFRISARSVLKYTGQACQFKINGTIRNALTAALATATATVVDDETVTTNTTGSIACTSVTGAWAPSDTIFSGTLTADITNTTLNTTATLNTSTISGTTLTVGTLASGTIQIGSLVTGTGVTSGTYIVSNISGSGNGSTWTVNFPQGVTSTTITTTYNPCTVTSTANLFPGMGFRVTTTSGGFTAGTTYYVLGIPNSTTFTSTTALFGNTAVSLSTASVASTLYGIHGTITAVNTVGAFAPQPTSKIMAIRVFTEVNTAPANNYAYSNPTLSLTGLKAGSEVRVYRTADSSEITGTENSGTTFTAQYEYSADINVYIVVFHIDYLPVRYENQILGANGLSLLVQQTFDRQYSNPA